MNIRYKLLCVALAVSVSVELIEQLLASIWCGACRFTHLDITRLDSDGDGFFGGCDAYATVDADCDDTDPAVNTGAEEVCDGVDNDCDAETDDNLFPTITVEVAGFGRVTVHAPPGPAARVSTRSR